VVAFREGAVPEVLGDAGLLLDHKDPRAVADAVADVCTDAGRREALVAAGRARLKALDLGTAGSRVADLLLAAREGRRVSVR
jgi:glycosyltransferase involved in cell wall biosynthesis